LNGTNPFRIYVDACNFAVGGVLMQRPPALEETDASGPDFYRLLQSTPNSTKAELEASARALRKRHRTSIQPLEEAQQFEKACETLLNMSLRKEYDAQRGLGSRKHSDLVLLGCFSQSMAAAQRNWTTWEKELLRGCWIVGHSSTIVMGAFTVLHTDHTNSTLTQAELKNPDKILRMLLYLESSLQLTWRFVSGIANPAGDGFSRNPADRDQVKDSVESKLKTFGEAWEMARGSARSQADTDFLTRSSFVEGKPDFRRQGYQPVFVRPQYDAATTDLVLAAEFAPGCVSEDAVSFDLSQHVVKGDGVQLQQRVVVQPPFISGVGSRRWLESLPLSKRD
jgi:hypothetical protein